MKSTVVLLLILMALIAMSHVSSLRAATAMHGDPTTLSIQPVVTCCASNAPIVPGGSFTVDVRLNLAAGESMNGFDVRVNYTNPYSNAGVGAVRAQTVLYGNNIFANYTNQVSADCIDGTPQSGFRCASDDSFGGQIHFAEAIIGTYTGPASGILFSVTFLVTGMNSSVFYFDRAILINPKGISDPSTINPHFIETVTLSGSFGNNGIVAFFNYQTDDPSLSPAILPTIPVDFNASQSVNANDTSIQIVSYAWDFGDHTTGQNSSTVSHAFATAGTYFVKLTVTDSNRKTGSFTWPVVVLPRLGTLLLVVVDSRGSPITSAVLVQAFNSSSSNLPFLNQSISVTSQAELTRLIPGTYLLKFSGPTVLTTSKEETVIPGFTVRDLVVLNSPSLPPDYSGIIFLGSTVAALVFATIAIVVTRRRARRSKSKKLSILKKTK